MIFFKSNPEFMSKLKLFTPSTTQAAIFEGLQGLGMVLLLLYHCFPVLYKAGTGIGWIGIDLYLVVFGFLLTSILFENKSQKDFFVQFFKEKAIEVLPLYFLFLLVFFVGFPLLMGSNWKLNYLSYHQNQLWHWLLVQNWFPVFHNDWISEGRTPVLDHLWLVAFVCQFALIWGLLVYLFNRKTLIFISLFLLLLSVVLRNIFVSQGLHFSVSYIFTFARLDTACIGTLIALLLTEEKGRVMLEKSAIPVLIGSVLLLVATIVLSRSLSLKDAYFIRWGYSLLAL
ncbi:MAG: hypothetical protein H7Y04_10615, partial [Verrucomicrobia bacterium]|nr:hypothetical protein [Cytophagales bacterium]